MEMTFVDLVSGKGMVFMDVDGVGYEYRGCSWSEDEESWWK